MKKVLAFFVYYILYMYIYGRLILWQIRMTLIKKNLFSYLESAIDYNDVINVNTKKGNAIIISEAEYNGLLETLYLLSDPTMKEKIEAAKKASDEDYEVFEW